MPVTGQDFDQQVDIKTDRAYSDYFDDAKKTEIYEEALIKAARLSIAKNDKAQVQDDLFSLIKADQVFPISANAISLIVGGVGIDDYLDIIEVKAKFQDTINAIVKTVVSATPIKVAFQKKQNLRDGELVEITGVGGTTNANGSRYVKRLRDDLVYLYGDKRFQTAIAGNGAYTGGGVVQRYQYNRAHDIKNAQKYGKLNEPTVHEPGYDIAGTELLLYPADIPCSEITIDYYAYPTQFIDPTDNVVDLLAFYGHDFLFLVQDEAAKLMGQYSRDVELANYSEQRIMKQP